MTHDKFARYTHTHNLTVRHALMHTCGHTHTDTHIYTQAQAHHQALLRGLGTHTQIHPNKCASTCTHTHKHTHTHHHKGCKYTTECLRVITTALPDLIAMFLIYPQTGICNQRMHGQILMFMLTMIIAF